MAKHSFETPAYTAYRPARSRKPLVFIGGVLLGVLVWFAPAIIVNSPLKQRILAAATGDFTGTVVIDSISASWLSGLTARSIVVTDAQGERLAEVASIRLDKSLLALLSNYSDLGTIHVQQPILHLNLRADGSNLEDAIAPWLVPSDEPTAMGLEVQIQDGLIQVTDTTTRSQWTANKIQATVGLPQNANLPLTLQVDTQIDSPTSSASQLAAKLLWQRNAETAAGKSNLSIQATDLPLELASPALARLLPGVSAAGVLNGDVLVDWGAASTIARVGQLAIRNLQVSAPQWLGTDRVTLASFNAAGEVTQQGDTWQVQQAQVTSDVGQLTAQGAAVLTSSSGENWSADLLRQLLYSRFRVDGQLDLARIAQMLPQTLKIRPGTHVATGEVTLAYASDREVSGQRWDGRIEARNLAAMHEGRRLVWEQPVLLTAAARDLDGVIRWDKLACDSSFLKATATGTSDQGSATLQGDFARFAAEVSRFVDLGDLRLAGQLDGTLNWRKLDAQRLQLEAAATAQQFELVSANRPAWREDRLSVEWNGIGNLAEHGLRIVEQGNLQVRSGQDQLDLRMLAPPAGTLSTTAWPIEARLTGDVAHWMARLQPIVVLEWDLNGAIDLTAKASVADDRVQLTQAKIHLTDFQAANGTMFIREPIVQLETQGVWEQATQTFNSPDTTLASTSLSLRAQQLAIRSNETGVQVAGGMNYRGDVGRLYGWLNNPQQPTTQQFQGQAAGNLVLRVEQGVTSAEATADITNFAYLTATTTNVPPNASGPSTGRWNRQWEEPKLKLSAVMTYDHAADNVNLSRIEAAGETVSLAAQGKITGVTQRCITELDGQLAYDLQKLSARLRPQLGDSIQVAGQGTRPFSFRGPLFAAEVDVASRALHPISTVGGTTVPQPASVSVLIEMLAQASLGWTSATVHGLTIGNGELDAKLADGLLTIAPIDLPVSEGRIRLAPQVRLDQTPMVITLPAGPVVEKVRISPQMCTTWLKYVAPLVADATAAEGTFSVTLQRASIPVDLPSSGEVEGVLEVHAAQIGPGPLSQQLLWLAAQIKGLSEGNPLGASTSQADRWLDLPPQRIGFRMAENRVYHQGMQMSVKDVVIRTSGSVGTDQSLSLVAEVPIRDEWLTKSRYLASLRGEVLQIPIRGTLSSPQLDQGALRQITQQTLTGAANQVIGDEVNKQLNRGLEKLFGVPR